jgi:hypothetical protein
MSNDLTILNQAPDYLKEVGIDNMTKALAGNTAVKRISIRGGVFRMMVNGEEIAKNENRAMNVVIVHGNPHVSRQFYAGKYVAGETTSPDCWSNDGDKPDASIEYPQAKTCEGCPQNIKGSGQGDSRACRYQQRLAVLLADDIAGDVFQLLLPAQSIFGRGDVDKMPFQQYAKYVGSMGRSLGTLITEMRMDSDSATREQWLVAKEKADSPAAKAAVTQTAAQTDGGKQPAIKAAPKAAAPAAEVVDVPEPTKRASKKAAEPTPKKDFVDVLNTWSTDDE